MTDSEREIAQLKKALREAQGPLGYLRSKQHELLNHKGQRQQTV